MRIGETEDVGSSALDALDRRILAELQKDAAQSMRRLAERVASTPATCHRRYQRLKRSGHVRRIIAVVDPAITEGAVTLLIGVTLHNQQQRSQRAMQEFIGARSEILMAWMTTGEFDYMLVASFPDSKSYVDFLEEELQAVPGLDRYRSFISLDEVKFNPFRPVAVRTT